MIGRAFLKALDQMGDRTFRKVMILGLLLTIAVFAGLLFGLILVMPESIQISDWDWLNDLAESFMGFAAYPLVFLVAWFFFPAVATMFIGLFLDDIVDAVENEHYPGHKATRRLGVGETILSALKLSAVIVILNLLAIPAYLLLFFIIPGVGPFILYLMLNGYLLGREYYELVASRHYARREAAAARREARDKVFMSGAGITLLFAIPILNLAAPILGAAAMVHIFHGTRAEGRRV